MVYHNPGACFINCCSGNITLSRLSVMMTFKGYTQEKMNIEGAVTMATPATIVGDIRDAPHLAASVNEL